MRKRPDLEKHPDPHKIGARRPSELRVGDKVLYYPVFPKSVDQPPRATEICSPPWQLGHGAWVVMVAGMSGGVACEHLGKLP
jgi:hypothetical protein